MLIMLIFCIIGAAGSYLQSPRAERTNPRAFFVLFTLVAPMLLLMVMAVGRQLGKAAGLLRRKSARPEKPRG
jgi:hypothetical protein